MSKVLVTDDYLSDIAAAIRENNGESTLYKPAAMGPAIRALASSSASASSKWVRPDGWEDLDAIAAAGGDDFSGLYATYLVTGAGAAADAADALGLNNVISISGATKVEEITLVDGAINVVQEMDVTIDDSGVLTCDISGLTHGYHTFQITADSFAFAQQPGTDGIALSAEIQSCTEYYAKNTGCAFVAGGSNACSTHFLQRVVFDGVALPDSCKEMFVNVGTLCEFIAVSTSGAPTDMSYMFATCFALTSIDLSGLDTSNVTDMTYMFDSCFALTSLDLSGLDTSNVTNMTHMFDWCYALRELSLSNFAVSFDIGTSQLLAVSTLVAIFEALAAVSSATITIGNNNLIKLTDEQIAIATDKGWTVVAAES